MPWFKRASDADKDLTAIHRKARQYDALVAIAGPDLANRVKTFDRLTAELAKARRAVVRYGLSRARGGRAAKAPPYDLVIVFGSARTGTTLLASYLAWAEGTHRLPREAAPLLTAMQNRQRMINSEEVFLGEASPSAANIATQLHLRMFMDEYYAQETAGTLVFRNPALSRYIFELYNLLNFTTTRFICCLRDPRDACASILDWNFTLLDSGQKPVLPAHNAHAAATFFMSYYNPVVKFQALNKKCDLLFVKYEDLVQEPKAAATRLGAFTGLDLSTFAPDAGSREGAHDFQAERDTNFAVTPLYGQAPAETQIGRYVDQLKPNEIAVIERICKKFMTRFGYAVDPSQPT